MNSHTHTTPLSSLIINDRNQPLLQNDYKLRDNQRAHIVTPERTMLLFCILEYWVFSILCVYKNLKALD